MSGEEGHPASQRRDISWAGTCLLALGYFGFRQHALKPQDRGFAVLLHDVIDWSAVSDCISKFSKLTKSSKKSFLVYKAVAKMRPDCRIEYCVLKLAHVTEF